MGLFLAYGLLMPGIWLYEFPGDGFGAGISFKDVAYGRLRYETAFLHGLLYDMRNFSKENLLLQQGCYGNFIGAVHDACHISSLPVC